MKKLFVSIGLATAGTAALHAAYAPDAASGSKIWTLSGTFRGFYDDNYLTTPKKTGSVGFEVSPSFSLNAPLAQTEIGVRYVYGLYYYQDRERNSENPIDQSHQFDLWIDHAFNPEWETRFADTVTVAQEPQLLASGGAVTDPRRVSGDNLVNNAVVTLHTDWSDLFSTLLTYQNNFYNYQNHGATLSDVLPGGNGASLSGLLDRDENLISLDFQYHFTRETMVFVGYQYGQVNYLSSEPVAFNPYVPAFYYASSRDNRSQYGYVGASHNFLENLSGSVLAGVQYTTYYNDPSASSSFGPYGNASLIYTYAPGSYAQVGVTETRNATDTINVDSNGRITQDQESTVFYGSINHSLTAKLNASATLNYQYSTYHDGLFNNQSADYTSLGLNLTYVISPHLSSDFGYNFDWYKTAAALAQDYNRNRIYLGVTASY